MHIKKVFLIITLVLFTVLIGANVFQYISWGKKSVQLEANYQGQLDQMKDQIASIGPIVEAWTVTAQVSSGQKIGKDDLKPIETLQKTMSDVYVTNPEEIVGKFYKVAIKPGTPITKDLIMEEKMDKTLRQYEVITYAVPVGLKVGDYVDYRFVLPLGEDYIVMPHKRVEGIYGKTITFHLNENEIHTYQSLLIDCFLKNGSMIYMTKYLEPGVQEAAKPYYPIVENIVKLMQLDPNTIGKIESWVIKNKRDKFDEFYELLDEQTKEAISGGREAVVGSVDNANAAYWKVVGDALKAAADAQDPSGAGTANAPKSPVNQPDISQSGFQFGQGVSGGGDSKGAGDGGGGLISDEPSENMTPEEEQQRIEDEINGVLNIEEGIIR